MTRGLLILPGCKRLGIVAAALLLALLSAPAARADLIVNTASDTINPTCGSAGGTCSLRDVMTLAQGVKGWSIHFAIGTGHQTINIMKNLPDIITQGEIDGRSQPGYAGVPLIEIHRPDSGSAATRGLHFGQPPAVTQSGVFIRSLIINHFSGVCGDCGGIVMENFGGNTILGCYIGTDASGMVADGNSVGIFDDTFGGNAIGDGTLANRNVISGNGNGIIISSAQGGYTTQDIIQANYFGTNAAGTAAIPNAGVGISAGAPAAGFTPGILIGGPSGKGNLFGGAGGGSGLAIQLTDGQGNVVQGNTIGLNKTGLASLPLEHGIFLVGENHAQILNNVISVAGDAIRLSSSVASKAHMIKIQGNYLGTDVTGNKVLIGGGAGVNISSDGQDNTIGGSTPGQGNIIGGFGWGVFITGSASPGNFIIGNRIGIGTAGSPIPNVFGGVTARGAGGNTVVGGTGVGEGNVIAFNGQGTSPRQIAPGVSVVTGKGNVIRGNSMFKNTGKAIDFYTPTSLYPYPNDVGDIDEGPNRLQNFPLITSVTFPTPSSVRVGGTINSKPSTRYSIDFYADFSPLHPADFLQGQNWLGLFEPQTDIHGNASFDVTFTVPQVFPLNTWISATASDPGGIPGGNTSELSQRGVFWIQPTHGPATGGIPFSLAGQLFQAGAIVTFGSTPATGVNVTPAGTGITGSTPVLVPGGLYDVIVMNPDFSKGTMQKAFLTDFLDIPNSSPFYNAVVSLAGDGVTKGCGSGNYCPNDLVTRDQMAIFLLKSKYGPWYIPVPATGMVFVDVSAAAFGAAFIEELFHEGITTGCGGGKFCPTNPVSRGEMAVFLLRTKHGSSFSPPAATGTVFTDVSTSTPFAKWIEQLFVENITTGCGGGKFCPNDSVTRLQMAPFIVRTFRLP